MGTQPISTARALSVPVQRSVRSVTIHWGVSRLALGELAPEGSSPLVTLRYEATSGRVERWSLLDPAGGSPERVPERLNRACVIPELRVSGGRVHLQGPTLYAFVSIDGTTPELLYARTKAFQLLGIAGGRYKPMDAQVTLD